MAISPDAKLALVGSWDTSLTVINLTTLAPSRTLAGHDSYVNAVQVSADGKLAVVGVPFFFVKVGRRK